MSYSLDPSKEWRESAWRTLKLKNIPLELEDNEFLVLPIIKGLKQNHKYQLVYYSYDDTRKQVIESITGLVRYKGISKTNSPNVPGGPHCILSFDLISFGSGRGGPLCLNMETHHVGGPNSIRPVDTFWGLRYYA